MKFSQIPIQIRNDLRDSDYTLEQLEAMTPKEMFDTWLKWNGIIGYSEVIWAVSKSLHTTAEAGGR